MKSQMYKYDHKELYKLVIGKSKEKNVKKIFFNAGKYAKKTGLQNILHLNAPYRVSFSLLQYELQLKSQELLDEDNVDTYDHMYLKKMGMLLVDGMSISGIGYSPLWLLAILNEVSQGDKNYLETIQDEMRNKGYLDETNNYETIVELLESFYNKEGIDNKLFNYQTIGKIKDDLIELSSYNPSKLKVINSKLTEIWEKMHKIGKYENFSVNKINGIITFDIMRALNEKGLSCKEVTLLMLIDNYESIIHGAIVDSLSEFSSKGRTYYLLDKIKPFAEYYVNKKDN